MPVICHCGNVDFLANCMQFADFTEYSIESGNEGRVFAVDISTGALYTVGELSYQKQQVFILFIYIIKSYTKYTERSTQFTYWLGSL